MESSNRPEQGAGQETPVGAGLLPLKGELREEMGEGMPGCVGAILLVEGRRSGMMWGRGKGGRMEKDREKTRTGEKGAEDLEDPRVNEVGLWALAGLACVDEGGRLVTCWAVSRATVH